MLSVAVEALPLPERCTGLSTAIMPAPPVVAPTIVALDHLHQELSAVSADVAHDSFHATVPSTPLLHEFVTLAAIRGTP